MRWYQRLTQWWMTTLAWDDRVLFAISAAAHEVTATRTALTEQIDTMARSFQAEQEALRAEVKDAIAKATTHVEQCVENSESLVVDRIHQIHHEIVAAMHDRIRLVTAPPPTITRAGDSVPSPIPARTCSECLRLVERYATDRDGETRCLECHEALVARLARVNHFPSRWSH